jgi:predicted RNA-binding protein YlqC (UPF0109 family)
MHDGRIVTGKEEKNLDEVVKMANADSENQLVSLIEFVVKALVDKPDAVRVGAVRGEQTTVIELHVDKEDLGKVIGKQGRTAQSLRTILNAASTKLKLRSVLEIIE